MFAERPPAALKFSINGVGHMPIYNHDVDENLPGIGRIGADHHLPRHWRCVMVDGGQSAH
jgi:hypothetical protein